MTDRERSRHLVAKRVEVFLGCARQEVEEGVEAPIERASELRDGAIDRVQRYPSGRSVRERERGAVN